MFRSMALLGMCLSINLLNDSHQYEYFASAVTELSSDTLLLSGLVGNQQS